MNIRELKQEVKGLVEQGEMDEDILVAIEDCQTLEEAERILEEYGGVG